MLLAGCSDRASVPAAPAPDEGVIADVRAGGELVIAVPYEGRPPEGEVNPSLTIYRGFEVELARLVAESLGVELRFAPSSSSATTTLPRGAGIHVSFPHAWNPPSDAVTTRPYLDSEVRLLVRKESGIADLQDLRSRPSCTIAGAAAELVRPRLDGVVAEREHCFSLLRRGRVVAVAGLDLALGRAAADRAGAWLLTGPALATVPLAAVLPEDGADLARYVGGIISRAEQEGLIGKWHEKWVTRFER